MIVGAFATTQCKNKLPNISTYISIFFLSKCQKFTIYFITQNIENISPYPIIDMKLTVNQHSINMYFCRVGLLG